MSNSTYIVYDLESMGIINFERKFLNKDIISTRVPIQHTLIKQLQQLITFVQVHSNSRRE